jgi:ABC-type transporter Mla MlaB component
MFLHQIEESLKLKRQTAVLLKEQEVQQVNPVDSATVDVPLLIRLLEFAREDAKTDMDLHHVTENIIRLSATGKMLTMSDYEIIVGGSGDV